MGMSDVREVTESPQVQTFLLQNNCRKGSDPRLIPCREWLSRVEKIALSLKFKLEEIYATIRT